MMKKFIAGIFLLIACMNSSFGFSNQDIPNEFMITEHWISWTTSFDIKTKTKKLGTLYRKFLSFLLTYEFFDPFDNKLATATSRFFSFTARFDVYDQDGLFLGFAEERLFTFFPTFSIYANDASTLLARAEMNFWGTRFTIYDPVTKQKIAEMNRSFLRLKNNWSVHITNRPLFLQKNIDPKLLMTVLAFQGDRENWESQNSSMMKSINTLEVTSKSTHRECTLLLEKVAAVIEQQGFGDIKQPEQALLESLINELDEGYKSEHTSDNFNETSQEKIRDFTNYCLDLVQSNTLSDSKKKSILFLLKIRLNEGAMLI